MTYQILKFLLHIVHPKSAEAAVAISTGSIDMQRQTRIHWEKNHMTYLILNFFVAHLLSHQNPPISAIAARGGRPRHATKSLSETVGQIT